MWQSSKRDVIEILAFGEASKIAFAPKKYEMMHFAKKRRMHAPTLVVNETFTIEPTITSEKPGEQPAIKWLGVWFDRYLTFKRHVAERCNKSHKLAWHIRNLTRTIHGYPSDYL
ncbi:hypothetical protein K3495_g9683 [Podosphaera aphanis]|nr:hypothetical protein K3495_g9683 [Podosphaera aphanis]